MPHRDSSERELNILKGHIRDLAERSFRDNIYTFTDFLGLSQQSALGEISKDIAHAGLSLYGGFSDSERVVARFGKEEDFGYSVDFPIKPLKLEPVSEKFGESLSHRDVLGALMNLGIKRELLGDILIQDGQIILFALEKAVPFIKENLISVKHTNVLVREYKGEIDKIKLKTEVKQIQVSSLRLDGIIAKVFKLSRDQSNSLFGEKRVFLNGRLVNNTSLKPKEGDIISVRKKGRVRFVGEKGTTRKGNLMIELEIFV